MIYFIGNPKLFTSNDISTTSLDNLNLFVSLNNELAVDTETQGFSPFTNKLLSIQIGNLQDQFVIDTLAINPSILKEVFSKDLTWIFHNAKFDLKFLYHHGILLNKVYDTFLVECLLTAGIEERKLGLKDLGLKYCNIELDKSVRGLIHKVGLSDEVIKYGANDVKYLLEIKKKQLLEVTKWELDRVVEVENEVVKVFSLMEYNGVPFNKEKWRDIAIEVEASVGEIERELDTIVAEDNRLSKYKNPFKQGNLFFEEVARKSIVNWASNKQKLEILKKLGLKVESTGDAILQKYKSNTLVSKLIDYNKQNKLLSSFGHEFIKNVNTITDRIHPSYWQILHTGRISVSEPNINQIPSHGELATRMRSAFEAPKGYKFVGGDYSGMELRIMAEFSQEELWLNVFNNNGDLHSELCAKTFNIPIEDVKKPFPPKPTFKYRDVQKTIDFGIPYGMSEHKLSSTMSITVEEAKKILDDFLNIVPKLKKFLATLRKIGYERGYIRTGNPFRRIRWFNKVEDDFRIKGSIERASMNTPIQGSNADICKQAMIFTQQDIDENNYPVQIIMQVYDEIQTICKEEFAEEWAVKLKAHMVNAAKLVIKSIPVEVDIKINDCWSK